MSTTTETKRLVKEVTFKLQGEELVKIADKAAMCRLAKVAIEEEFGRVKAAYKGKIQEKETELAQLLQSISERQQKKTVEVEERIDFEHNSLDTIFEGRVIESRILSPDERQLALFDGEEEKKQADLELDGRPPVELPAPTKVGDEVFVPGEPNQPVTVKHGPITWVIEAGDPVGATFVVVEEEIFGRQSLGYKRADRRV